MRRALDEFYVRGVSHNVPFLAALMAHPRFVAGRLTTNFIAEEFKGGFSVAHPAAARSRNAGRRCCRRRSHAGAARGWRRASSPATRRRCRTSAGDAESPADRDRRHRRRRHFVVETDGRTHRGRDRLVARRAAGAGRRSTAHRIVVQVDAVGAGWRLIHAGGQAEALVLTPRQAELYALMPVKAAPDTLEVPAVADAGPAGRRSRSARGRRSRPARRWPWSRR